MMLVNEPWRTVLMCAATAIVVAGGVTAAERHPIFKFGPLPEQLKGRVDG